MKKGRKLRMLALAISIASMTAANGSLASSQAANQPTVDAKAPAVAAAHLAGPRGR